MQASLRNRAFLVDLAAASTIIGNRFLPAVATANEGIVQDAATLPNTVLFAARLDRFPLGRQALGHSFNTVSRIKKRNLSQGRRRNHHQHNRKKSHFITPSRKLGPYQIGKAMKVRYATEPTAGRAYGA